MKNIELYNKLLEIILSCNVNSQAKDYAYRLSKKQILQLVKDYLSNQETSYALLFDKFLAEKRIGFHPKYHSHFNRINEKVKIRYTHTLDDAFATVHEFRHFYDFDEEVKPQMELLSETSALLEELRFGEYLKDTSFSMPGIMQLRKILYDNYLMVQKFSLVSKGVCVCDYNYNEVIKRIRYLLGILLSIYINTNIKNGNMSFQDYQFLRDKLSILSFEDISGILNIDISFEKGIVNIPDTDLTRLEKTYRIEMK